jgi:hypothetical protein
MKFAWPRSLSSLLAYMVVLNHCCYRSWTPFFFIITISPLLPVLPTSYPVCLLPHSVLRDQVSFNSKSQVVVLPWLRTFTTSPSLPIGQHANSSNTCIIIRKPQPAPSTCSLCSPISQSQLPHLSYAKPSSSFTSLLPFPLGSPFSPPLFCLL